METKTLSIKEKAQRDYDAGYRAGPSKRYGDDTKNQLRGLESFYTMKQMLMETLPEESRRLLEGSDKRSNEGTAKLSVKKQAEVSKASSAQTVSPPTQVAANLQQAVKPEPPKKTKALRRAPAVGTPSSNVLVSFKRPHSIDLTFDEESSPAHKVKPEIEMEEKELNKAGYTPIKCPFPTEIMDPCGRVFPLTVMGVKTMEVTQPDGTKINLPWKFMMKY